MFVFDSAWVENFRRLFWKKKLTEISSGPLLTAKSQLEEQVAEPLTIAMGSVDQDSSQRPKSENWQKTSENSSGIMSNPSIWIRTPHKPLVFCVSQPVGALSGDEAPRK